MSPTLKAALWMIGAIASFSAMALAGRLVSLEHDTFEIMLYRSLIGLTVVGALAAITGRWREITRRHIGLHLIRNLGHFTGQNLWFYAITVIPLAQVFALEFTSPLWALLMAPVFLQERITRDRLLAAGLGFIGILVVTRPFTAEIGPGVMTAALAAIGFAISAIFTRKLTRSESVICILFYLTLMQSGFGLVTAGIDGHIAAPSLQSLPWLLVIGLGGLFAHFCMTSALALAPATVVIPIDFTRLPVIALLGMALFDERLDPFVLLGAGFIFAGNFLNIRAETRQPSL